MPWGGRQGPIFGPFWDVNTMPNPEQEWMEMVAGSAPIMRQARTEPRCRVCGHYSSAQTCYRCTAARHASTMPAPPDDEAPETLPSIPRPPPAPQEGYDELIQTIEALKAGKAPANEFEAQMVEAIARNRARDAREKAEEAARPSRFDRIDEEDP